MKIDLRLLKAKGIEFADGLSDKELIDIAQEYGIEFPHELKELYRSALPVSNGFYNWRDFSASNTNRIKSAIRRPFDEIYEMADEVSWCEAWGTEPEEEKRVNVIRQILGEAPALIPIYIHRYMPMLNKPKLPIFSIRGADIIYYGEDLTSYFKIEFGNRKQLEIDFQKIEHVPFWSDIL